jgi:hypothetical protein
VRVGTDGSSAHVLRNARGAAGGALGDFFMLHASFKGRMQSHGAHRHQRGYYDCSGGGAAPQRKHVRRWALRARCWSGGRLHGGDVLLALGRSGLTDQRPARLASLANCRETPAAPPEASWWRPGHRCPISARHLAGFTLCWTTSATTTHRTPPPATRPRPNLHAHAVSYCCLSLLQRRAALRCDSMPHPAVTDCMSRQRWPAGEPTHHS